MAASVGPIGSLWTLLFGAAFGFGLPFSFGPEKIEIYRAMFVALGGRTANISFAIRGKSRT